MKVNVTKNEEMYTVCPNCGEVVPRKYDFCPKCGARLFRPADAPLLMLAAGIYLLNVIIIFILFAPFLLFTSILELGTAISLFAGRKAGGGFSLILLINIPFLIYFCIFISFSFLALILIFTHLIGVYLVVKEWDKLA